MAGKLRGTLRRWRCRTSSPGDLEGHEEGPNEGRHGHVEESEGVRADDSEGRPDHQAVEGHPSRDRGVDEGAR